MDSAARDSRPASPHPRVFVWPRAGWEYIRLFRGLSIEMQLVAAAHTMLDLLEYMFKTAHFNARCSVVAFNYCFSKRFCATHH